MLSGLTWSNLAIEEVAEEVLCVEHGQTEAGQLVGNPEVSKCHREKRSTSNATLHGGTYTYTQAYFCKNSSPT